MIVDSTALLEQAVQDVVTSAFQSAGQRCSACRLVCVQSDIAEEFIEMVTGAMRTLKIGDPANLATDVGPVIDAAALTTINSYMANAKSENKVVFETRVDQLMTDGFFAGPVLIKVDRISDVKREVFGPVLHLMRFQSTQLHSVIEEINALGFGLTMGLHTRLDDRVDDIARMAHVGNLYVNRNQIGAVVGIHPFGGEGLSGTGPKAGGPHYLFGLTKTDGISRGRERFLTPRSTHIDPIDDSARQVLRRAKTAASEWQSSFSVDDRRKLVLELFAEEMNA